MDSILYWNAVALEANRVSHTNGRGEQNGPTLSSRALAIIHLAMYDAYAGVVNLPSEYPPYLSGLGTVPTGTSAQAAVASAAHATLSALFPSQQAYFNEQLQAAGLTGSGLQEGHLFGLKVAQAVLADRKDDPDAKDNGYAASTARGAHRVDPDNPSQGFHAPFYGARSKCFSVTKRHALDKPPQPIATDTAYMRAFQQVRSKGIKPELIGSVPASQQRTVDETLIGVYWGYDGAAELGTPPRLYNQIVREVAMARGNSEGDNARLFAFVNVAMADAGILAWEQKYRYDYWRPVVGIREHDGSMGPSGTGTNDISNDCDPSWLPLGAPTSNKAGKNFTPNFPAYPSGHATFGAAALHITRMFYGISPGNKANDSLSPTEGIVSDEHNGVTTDNQGTVRPRHRRTFPRRGLWGMIEENGLSRVYLGVHWMFDAFATTSTGAPDLSKNVGGVPLGLSIAEDIFVNGGRAPKKSSVGPAI